MDIAMVSCSEHSMSLMEEASRIRCTRNCRYAGVFSVRARIDKISSTPFSDIAYFLSVKTVILVRIADIATISARLLTAEKFWSAVHHSANGNILWCRALMPGSRSRSRSYKKSRKVVLLMDHNCPLSVGCTVDLGSFLPLGLLLTVASLQQKLFLNECYTNRFINQLLPFLFTGTGASAGAGSHNSHSHT